MDDGNLSFLEEEVTPAAPEPAVETPPAPEPQADTGAPASPPEVKPEEQPHTVPISAILDEREKRQIAQRELEDTRRKLAEYEAAKSHPIPDPAEDPRAFAAYQQQAFEQRMWNERLNMSETMERQKHGDAVVDEAREAFAQAVKASPALYSDMQRQPNPYAFVVQWHQRQKLIDEIGNDPAAYRTRMMEQIKAELAAQATASGAPTTPKQTPPPSMAAAPSAGGADLTTKGGLFDQVIP